MVCFVGTAQAIAASTRGGGSECGEAGRQREAETTACALTVKLGGGVNYGSRLRLVGQALQRRDTVQRALQREVDFHVDVDSQGGESSRHSRSAGSCGQREHRSRLARGFLPQRLCLPADGCDRRNISGDARVGIHRPSLRAPQEGGPRQGSEDKIVDAISEQLVLYAQQMNVPRQIIDALMLIPPDRVELLSASELATYGIQRVDAVALEERCARSQSLRHPRAAQQPSP